MKKLWALFLVIGFTSASSQPGQPELAGAEIKSNERAGHRAARPQIVARRIEETDPNVNSVINVLYPQIIEPVGANAVKFNDEMKTLVMNNINDFKRDLGPPDPDLPAEIGQNTYDGDYTVALATDKLVSIAFAISTYGAGAAHPNSYTWTCNYDLATGRQLDLGDLFKPDSDYLRVISNYSIEVLKRTLAPPHDMAWINEGAGPSADNYNSWTITPRGLRIYFNPYQVASYAEGPQEVVIPYSFLRNITAPDSALGAMR